MQYATTATRHFTRSRLQPYIYQAWYTREPRVYNRCRNSQVNNLRHLEGRSGTVSYDLVGRSSII